MIVTGYVYCSNSVSVVVVGWVIYSTGMICYRYCLRCHCLHYCCWCCSCLCCWCSSLSCASPTPSVCVVPTVSPSTCVLVPVPPAGWRWSSRTGSLSYRTAFSSPHSLCCCATAEGLVAISHSCTATSTSSLSCWQTNAPCTYSVTYALISISIRYACIPYRATSAGTTKAASIGCCSCVPAG